jgi:hypothetical protein
VYLYIRGYTAACYPEVFPALGYQHAVRNTVVFTGSIAVGFGKFLMVAFVLLGAAVINVDIYGLGEDTDLIEIGRASCRERV